MADKRKKEKEKERAPTNTTKRPKRTVLASASDEDEDELQIVAIMKASIPSSSKPPKIEGQDVVVLDIPKNNKEIQIIEEEELLLKKLPAVSRKKQDSEVKERKKKQAVSLEPKTLAIKEEWDTAAFPSLVKAPPSYQTFYKDFEPDEVFCRRCLIPAGATLQETKEIILHAYEDQYQPHEIDLFFRDQDWELKRISSKALLKEALSYPDGFKELDSTDGAGAVLAIVSPMNTEENELLVVPAMKPPTQETLLEALLEPAGTPKRIPDSSMLLLQRLLKHPSAFHHLPTPLHIDDWHAQYREIADSVSNLALSRRRPPLHNGAKGVIYILPIVRVKSSSSSPGVRPPKNFPALPLSDIVEYTIRYFDLADGGKVVCLPPAELAFDLPYSDKRKRSFFRLFGEAIEYRTKCPVNDKEFPFGQFNACDLVDMLQNVITKKSKQSPNIPNAYCILGATMEDLYSEDSDLFTAGLANIRTHVGIFSFHRYYFSPSGSVLCSPSASVSPQAFLVSRACKTAVHELIHMLGSGHCVYVGCCMNGSGHIAEDLSITHHLCPIDLAKLHWVFGESFDIMRRFKRLLEFYEKHEGFETEAHWTRDMIAYLES